MAYKITAWCSPVTDSGENVIVAKKPKNTPYKFRLLDDDGTVYAYGYSTSNDDEDAFEPLDDNETKYGVTEIQYRNEETGEYETL